MRVLHDYEGLAIRLTDERLAHIMDHPEMAGFERAIEETLARPQQVVESPSDPQARLYYRYYLGPPVGDKYLCDAFVLTAYITDKVKRGVQIWPRES